MSTVKRNKEPPPRARQLQELNVRHKRHTERLEQVQRALMNDAVSPEQVDELKDSVDIYIVRPRFNLPFHRVIGTQPHLDTGCGASALVGGWLLQRCTGAAASSSMCCAGRGARRHGRRVRRRGRAIRGGPAGCAGLCRRPRARPAREGAPAALLPLLRVRQRSSGAARQRCGQ